MSQFSNPQLRRASGSIDVYTGLLFAAILVLAAGVFIVATSNIEHSGEGSGSGGVLKLID